MFAGAFAQTDGMDLELLFKVVNSTALVGWLLIAVLPRWRPSARLIAPIVVPFALAVVYAVLLLPRFASADGGFDSLAGVGQLFDVPELLLAGWIHYLAFDLFLGAWEVRDAQRHGVPHLFVLPCLALTFMLGPSGLAAYLVVRARKAGVLLDGTD